MSDLISRKLVIDTIMAEPTEVRYPSWYAYIIKQLPTSEPGRMTGRWITDGKQIDNNGIEWNMMHCSVCDHKDIDSEVTRTPFCPWCGARMDGEQETFTTNVVRSKYSDDFKGCGDCVHAEDDNALCILRKCSHAISELEDCYKPIGQWVESDISNEKYVCSVCGGSCWYYDWQGEVAKSKFCPNCGSRMDGGKV